MPFVQRNQANKIKGIFARRQSGIAEEFLPKDDAEIQAFLNPPPPTNDEVYNQTLQNNKLLKALILCLNDGSIVPGANVSGASLRNAIKAKM